MDLCGFTMSFTTAGIHGLYAVMACFMWFVSLAFSLEYMHHYKHKAQYYAFMLATFGATAGVFLSADLLTTFVFFEIMSFTSYVLVIHDESKGAMRAGETYLAVAVIGGMVMLMGLFLLYDLTGTLKIAELADACAPYAGSGRLYAAAVCMLVGFGAKAGMFPLHIWLPKAHPVAPAPASALLSGILTKAGIYGALIICCRMLAGDEHWAAAILAIGAVTMFLGAFLAVFSSNLKKTLACSSVSQIGFITVGIGIACLTNNLSEMASKGTVLHMVNHSLIKLLLFSCAGVVYMNLHKLALSDVRGWGRNKPLLGLYFAIGALTISGVPGTSGYISKTLLHESIVEVIEEMEHAGEAVWMLKGLEWIFLISGGLTFAYMSRLFFCLFIRKNRAEEVQKGYNNKMHPYMNVLSASVIALPAAAMLCIGAVYWQHHYYTWTNLKGSLTSLAIGGLLCLLLKGKDLKELKFDLEDQVYRPVLLKGLVPLLAGIASILTGLGDNFVRMLQGGLLRQIQPHEERFSPMDWLRGRRFAQRWQEIRMDVLDSANSLSFGLLMAVLGLCVFLIYLVRN
ncbi:MAG: NADH dehydrogenase [Firmicutes bacterium]|nr:NADH dehydrogenase [Bacillota bacterium]